MPDRPVLDYASLRRRRPRRFRRRLAIKFIGRGFAGGLWLGFSIGALTGQNPLAVALIMLAGLVSIIIGDRVLPDRKMRRKSG